MSEPHPIVVELAALRVIAGLSKVAVGRRIFYTGQSIGFWEAGKVEPSLEAIDAYAGVVGYRLALGGNSPILEGLRKARLDAGLTQAEVARGLGCRLNSVSRWEHGHRRLTLAKASTYARLVGLELRLVVADAHQA